MSCVGENISWPFRASTGRVLNSQLHSSISSKVLAQEFQRSQEACLGSITEILCANFSWFGLLWVVSFHFRLGKRCGNENKVTVKKPSIYQPKPFPLPLHTALCSSTFLPAFWAHLPDLSTQTKHAKHCTSHCCLQSLYKSSQEFRPKIKKSQAYFFLLKMKAIHSCQSISSICF